ncbi:hypothetical protein ACQPXM_13930 [Kribbella sp. CA-253562]|uniref:hypothetical protein n=1 Tax=Kribbella sp. CA-253562 TaxID=3239942 RepID=UPI003D928E9D
MEGVVRPEQGGEMLSKSLGSCVALVLAGTLILPLSAAADPEPGSPECRLSPTTGECQFEVTDPGKPATGDPGQGDKTKSVSKSGCVFEGKPIPCTTEDGFWDPSSGCYLLPQDKPMTLGDMSKIKPGSKFYRCWVLLDVVDGKPVGEARFESEIKEPGEPETIDPRVAARQVVDDMNFVAPQLGLSPFVQSARHEGVVNSPVWMWVTDPGESTTGPLSAHVSLGGVTIEAVGTVDRIEWSMGDGNTVTCKGAGTPFDRNSVEGKSLREVPASPTCGHKYVKTSRCEQNGKFPVSATAYWNVHWTGGGMEGDIPLQFSRSTSLSVIDLRPVLVATDGGSEPEVSAPARSC